ncbi:hypothetical protein [Synechococcus sp. HK01-R]|nr:hypothetical protein [Synechococcus sp. HK01-R]
MNCDSSGECTGGDIYGAAYAIGMRDYTAIGVSKRSSFVLNNGG